MRRKQTKAGATHWDRAGFASEGWGEDYFFFAAFLAFFAGAFLAGFLAAAAARFTVDFFAVFFAAGFFLALALAAGFFAAGFFFAIGFFGAGITATGAGAGGTIIGLKPTMGAGADTWVGIGAVIAAAGIFSFAVEAFTGSLRVQVAWSAVASAISREVISDVSHDARN